MKQALPLAGICMLLAAGSIWIWIQKGSSSRRSEVVTGTGPTVISASDFRLEDHRGQVLVLDFWATWCGPCRMAMPGMQALHQRFQGRPVRVVGMNCGERGDPVAFMRQNGYTYTLVTGADNVARQFGVTGIPHFVVLGFRGEELLTVRGYSPENEERLARVIEEYLARNGA